MAAKDTNPKTAFGQAKPPLGLVPGIAMVQLAEAFRDGADKYGPANWRQDPVSASTYFSATLRHLMAWQDGETIDPVSGVSHLAHAGANLCILMDANAAGTLIDDRPAPAPTGDLLRALTRPLVAKTTEAEKDAHVVDVGVAQERAYAGWGYNVVCRCDLCKQYRQALRYG